MVKVDKKIGSFSYVYYPRLQQIVSIAKKILILFIPLSCSFGIFSFD